MKVTEMKAEQESDNWNKRLEDRGSLFRCIFLLRDNAEYIFLSFLSRIDKVMGRHVWKKVDMSGGRWKAGDSVMYFIYILLSLPSVEQAKSINLSFSLSILSVALRCCVFFYFNYRAP